MSNSDNEVVVNIDIQRKGLRELPVNDPNWSKAHGIFLQDNEISELNADLLPRGLKFLDLTGNPIKKVSGTFPPQLISLVLSGTDIQKLGSLPETITELVITGTPLAEKYRITSDIRSLQELRRISDYPIEKGTVMVDNTPGERDIDSNSNSNNNDKSVNINAFGGGSPERAEYNSDDTRYLVMIIEKVEDETDIKYRVQTLNHGEKLVFKQYLEAYEPSRASEIEPLSLTNPPAVYTKEGHGEDILFEKPVPPGCVYVTIEECSILSSNWGKLLFAFEDKPAGIREKLRDPVKYKKDLLAHFGRAFHVHYPEAEKHGDRTYVESIHYPFLAWNREECKIGKSGVLSLDDNNVFVDDTIVAKEPYDEQQVLKIIDCNNIKDEDLHKLLDGSKFPTYQMVKDDLSYFGDGSIKYADLRSVMNRYAFTQSWSFKMFPGVHYNFSCRDIAKHSPENERIGRRRANSLEGPSNNINSMSDEEIKSDTGYSIFSGYARAGISSMADKMIERGVDINKKDVDGKTLLQWAASKFNVDLVKKLLKLPNIDKTGAVEAVEEPIPKLMSIAKTHEERVRRRKEADDLIALIKGDDVIKGGSRYNKKKTRGRSRRVRKTRRVKRFK